MNKVDKFWLRALILGIIVLIGYAGIMFYESSAGLRTSFTEVIKPFTRSTLLTDGVLNHLRTDGLFSSDGVGAGL